MKQLTMKLPDEKHRVLKMLAASTGKTMTELVIEWIEKAKEILNPQNMVDGIPIRTFSDEEVAEWEKMDELTPEDRAKAERIFKNLDAIKKK